MSKGISKRRSMLKGAIYALYGSQSEFAAVIGIAESRLSQIVTGRRPPNAGERAMMSRVLNCPMSILFPEEGQTK